VRQEERFICSRLDRQAAVQAPHGNGDVAWKPPVSFRLVQGIQSIRASFLMLYENDLITSLFFDQCPFVRNIGKNRKYVVGLNLVLVIMNSFSYLPSGRNLF